MSTWRLILKELTLRWLNFLLSTLALVATVALCVGFFTTADASRRETVRVTRDLGFNLRIIPKETDMDQFWSQGYSQATLPEDAVQRLANYKQDALAYNHLVATLQQHFPLDGKEVILTGLSPAVVAGGKKPMGFSIKPGTLHVGFQVAQRLNLSKGSSLTLSNRSFQVVKCLVESGTDDDIRIFGLLSDVQHVLGLGGRINEIKAIDCLCLTANQDPLSILRTEIGKALPEAKVIQLRVIADARAKQRQTAEKYFAFITPFLLLACAASVGILAVLNVRERRGEIGLLRALGHGSATVACLFLGRALLIGITGALTGYALGTLLALQFGPEIFLVTAKAIKPDPSLFFWTLVAAPLFAAISSLIPAMMAVAQDPALCLREE